MGTKKCPGCHSDMDLKKLDKKTHFRGVVVRYPSEAYVCRDCGLESNTIQQAGFVQRLISEGYRKKMHLLTGDEIRSFRKRKGWSFMKLAHAMNLEGGLIEKWEKGLIQSRAEDRELRKIFQGDEG